jgi:hypothetical protein
MQLIERRFGPSTLARADQQQPGRERLAPIQLVNDRPESAPDSVARDCGTRGAGDRIGDRRRRRRRVGAPDAPQVSRSDPSTITPKAFEVVARTDPSDQADSRVRPLARRFLMMLRPDLVLIRARNPCFLLLRWALGW